MAEETQGQTPNTVPPVKPEGEGQQQETQTFSKEYVHELREEAKSYRQQMKALAEKVDQFEAAQKQQTEKQLADQGEWKTLAEKREQELTAILARADKERKRSAVIAAAAKADFADPEDAVKLLELDNFKIENDSVAGLPEALAELAKAKPYLLKQKQESEQQPSQRVRFGATNPAGGQKPYTTSIGEGSIGGAGVVRKP